MPKEFNLQCAAGKTARVWLQGKGGGPEAWRGGGAVAAKGRRD